MWPSERTFEPGKTEVFSPETLDTLHAVNDEGTPQNMGQDEDVKLFEGCPRLRGETHQFGPLFQDLVLRHVIVEEPRLPTLVLLPPRVEPVGGRYSVRFGPGVDQTP